MGEIAKSSRALPVTLGFTAGYADTCGFVALFSLFTAHVTGNFVLLGASLLGTHPGVVAKLLALPAFILVVALTRLGLMRFQSPKGAMRAVLLAELVFLGLFLVCGVRAAPIVNPDAPAALLVAMMAVAAMAVQNAASRTVFVSLAPTTIMTGNVTQIVLDCVDFLTARTLEVRSATRARVARLAPPIAAFAAGAIAGALGFKFLGFWCLLAPIVIIGAVLAREW
jgi:uncharacterized membrane protein YoaK (UPF0700 family)